MKLGLPRPEYVFLNQKAGNRAGCILFQLRRGLVVLTLKMFVFGSAGANLVVRLEGVVGVSSTKHCLD